MNGSTIKKMTQAALPQPDMSRRNRSLRIRTNTQIQATQQKKMIIVQKMFRNG